MVNIPIHRIISSLTGFKKQLILGLMPSNLPYKPGLRFCQNKPIKAMQTITVATFV
jgi:hypothetical protein